MSEPSGVSIHFVSALLEKVRDPAPLLAQAGIDPGAARVPSSAYAALMRAVVAALDDEFFGRDSRRMKSGSFAMLCHAVIPCRTLLRALARATRFYGLLLDDYALSLQQRDGLMQLTVWGGDLFAHENLLLFLHRLACWLVNRRIPIETLIFGFERPAHEEEYRLVFGREARFTAGPSSLTIDPRFGALPVVRGESALKEFLALAPENLFVRYRPSHGTVHRVRLQLAGSRSSDWPGFAELARSLGMSASTLHRRLAAEDSSYQAIKDQIRRERATLLLRQGGRSIMSIAEELGFAEASAFHRAFRKWTGSAPGEFRHSV